MRKVSLICSLLLVCATALFAQTDFIANAPFGDHPRILMLKGEEADILKSIENDPVWKNLHKAILSESDKLIDQMPVERIQVGRRLLGKSREALRRIFFLSYAFRTSKEKKYADRAEKELLAISGFRDWNPSHFLDVAEMTMAAAIGYDWLYQNLSPSSRSIIKEAILTKGLEPSMDPRHNRWLKAEHNWNQVCNAGMTYGAMAIYEDKPELSKQIINRALETIVHAMVDYGPDGAYPEGYGYWGYGTSFNVMFISAIEKLFKKDFGLSAKPGFLNTASYLENMTGPSGKPFNYSDAGSNGGLKPAMFWFAKKKNDPSLLWVERSRLKQNAAEEHVNDRLLPAIMLWGAGTAIDKITPPSSTMWVGHGKAPVALMRSSWKDSNALFVGFKAGSVSVNHAHMDIGSFIMESDGERWAMDFGMQEYESLESKGIQLFGRTQDAERWTVFRLTNLVHNTLTVNNQHQRVQGYAPIIASSSSKNMKHAITDMSEVYKGALIKAKRGIAILNNQYVVVRDEIKATDTVTTIRWTMLTPASVKITGDNSAELTRNGKKLVLRVDSPGAIKMKTWSTDPPNDFDAPNPGTIMVGFEMTIPANTESQMNVFLMPSAAIGKTPAKINPLDQWPSGR